MFHSLIMLSLDPGKFVLTNHPNCRRDFQPSWRLVGQNHLLILSANEDLVHRMSLICSLPDDLLIGSWGKNVTTRSFALEPGLDRPWYKRFSSYFWSLSTYRGMKMLQLHVYRNYEILIIRNLLLGISVGFRKILQPPRWASRDASRSLQRGIGTFGEVCSGGKIQRRPARRITEGKVAGISHCLKHGGE